MGQELGASTSKERTSAFGPRGAAPLGQGRHWARLRALGGLSSVCGRWRRLVRVKGDDDQERSDGLWPDGPGPALCLVAIDGGGGDVGLGGRSHGSLQSERDVRDSMVWRATAMPVPRLSLPSRWNARRPDVCASSAHGSATFIGNRAEQGCRAVSDFPARGVSRGGRHACGPVSGVSASAGVRAAGGRSWGRVERTRAGAPGSGRHRRTRRRGPDGAARAVLAGSVRLSGPRYRGGP